MFLLMVVNYIKLTLSMLKLNLKSVMEYRTSFVMQIFAMLISNASFGFMWLIFFKRFPVVGGWTFQDTMLLLSLSSLNWGIVNLFASGTAFLAKAIANGELDYQLTLPKNLLWLIATSKANFATSIGDIIFGVMAYCFAGSLTNLQLLNFVLMVLITAVILFNFILITQSIGFFVGNFEDAADQLFIVLLFGTYMPQGGIHGFLKLIMMTILPVMLIGKVPVELIRVFSWTSLGILLGAAIVSTVFALWLFNRGLKRYESGNLIGVKM